MDTGPKRLRHQAALLITLACLPIAAEADTVLSSDLGPGGSFNTGFPGYCVTGPITGCGFQEVGDVFAPSITAQLTEIDVALNSEGSPQVAMSLNVDNGGVPGTALVNWTTTAPSFPAAALVVEMFSAGPTLQAGAKYWLVAAPYASTTQVAWSYNITGASGDISANEGLGWSCPSTPGCSTLTDPAFDVLGTATVTPEPGSILLLGTGVLGLARILGRKPCP